MAEAGANWWLERLNVLPTPHLAETLFRQHFVDACLAEWLRLEAARPGTWPEDLKITICFTVNPGFFLGTVLQAARGHKHLRVEGLYASMKISPACYEIEMLDFDEGGWLVVETKGTV